MTSQGSKVVSHMALFENNQSRYLLRIIIGLAVCWFLEGSLRNQNKQKVKLR